MSESKVENPIKLKQCDMGGVVFELTMPFVAVPNCEPLGRLAVIDGNSVIMLGRITVVEH